MQRFKLLGLAKSVGTIWEARAFTNHEFIPFSFLPISSVFSTPLRDRGSANEIEGKSFASKPLKKSTVLPKNPFVYTGPIHYLDTVQKVEEWCDIIRKHVNILALDAEWRPDRARNQDNRIALLQMCFRHNERIEVVLVHVRCTGIPVILSEILMSERILKIGTNLRIDDAKLKRHFNVHLRGVLDLAWSDNKILRRNTVFRKPFGIRQLVQRLLRKEMVKEGKWTTSDWERRPLKRQQVEYAALDVYAPFMVYEKMKLLENKQESAPPTEDLASVDTLQRNEVTGTNTA